MSQGRKNICEFFYAKQVQNLINHGGSVFFLCPENTKKTASITDLLKPKSEVSAHVGRRKSLASPGR